MPWKANVLSSKLIEDNSIPVPELGCWLWLRPLLKNGYGQIRINYKMYKAHQASYVIHKGEIPEGMFVLHSCDVKCCVNPDHLSIGTHQDNMDQAVSRGLIRAGIHKSKSFEKTKDGKRNRQQLEGTYEYFNKYPLKGEVE